MEEDERPGSWGLGDEGPDKGGQRGEEIQGQPHFVYDRSHILMKSIRINCWFFFDS